MLTNVAVVTFFNQLWIESRFRAIQGGELKRQGLLLGRNGPEQHDSKILCITNLSIFGRSRLQHGDRHKKVSCGCGLNSIFRASGEPGQLV